MPTNVRVVLDTGAFFPEKKKGQAYIDVGYFAPETVSDVIVYADGAQVDLPDISLGTGNQTVNVDHVAKDGNAIGGIQRTPSFDDHLLRKHDLYKNDVPHFKEDVFDCILRFSSGTFASEGVKPRTFKECSVDDGSHTGGYQTTKPIASDIVVDYQLGDKEDLKITSGKDELLSTAKIAPGARQIDIYIMNDISTVSKYFNTAIDHKAACCWIPNPDPPPMNG